MDTDRKGVAGDKPSTSDRPKLLYKYLDRYGLDAIANLELKVTPPNEFSDPFEFTPLFRAEGEKSYQACYRLYSEWCSKDPERRQEDYETFKKGPILDRSHELLRERFQTLVSKTFGVICLSADPHGLIQWAHYAAGHSGLVLELDFEAEPFRSLLASGSGDARSLCKVAYCMPDKRKAMSPHEPICDDTNEGITQLLLQCASEKSEEWRPENEYRLVVPLDLSDDRTKEPLINHRFEDGKMMYFLKLHSTALKRVILGVRVASEFSDKVRKAAALHGMEGRIVRARIDRQRYAVAVD